MNGVLGWVCFFGVPVILPHVVSVFGSLWGRCFGFKEFCCYFFSFDPQFRTPTEYLILAEWLMTISSEHVSLEEPGDSIRDLFIPLLKVTIHPLKGSLNNPKRGHPIAKLPGFKKTYSNKKTATKIIIRCLPVLHGGFKYVLYPYPWGNDPI